ncbi:hypothetical protein C7Y66_11010 [Chroococcidiopsis sp. CCALA 051]|uniref:MarR family transcriptional regulator n=1 Tax=Chroococcidiopsis sp. CCALA 051 TaxID=869949 RepID=UPI000D0CDDFD|nr:helix-turn-helix domain-containing protein [Chroococcidiopsis sp. CCALA 051]PSM49143.1 hypothetical protein C7Y66_11010 [Chroococcidiopsis sp. CCALA 051]
MTSEQKVTKKPLFYPLTHEEVLDLKDLTGVEIKVFLYVRTLDPFGDRNLEYSVTAVAEDLGLSKGAVSKAIKSLDAKGLVHVELTRVKIRIKADKSAVASFPIGNDVSQSEPGFPIGNQDFPEETEVSYRKPEFPVGNSQQPEPLPDKTPRTLQTNKTYIDFIQTLSEGEREIFLEFGRKKAANLPHPPELPDKWIAANFTELYKYFLASSAGREAKQEAIARKYDWENDPRLMDWLHKAYWEGHPWAVENEFEREERLAFLMWAQKTNAYAGRIADEPA